MDHCSVASAGSGSVGLVASTGEVCSRRRRAQPSSVGGESPTEGPPRGPVRSTWTCSKTGSEQSGCPAAAHCARGLRTACPSLAGTGALVDEGGGNHPMPVGAGRACVGAGSAGALPVPATEHVMRHAGVVAATGHPSVGHGPHARKEAWAAPVIRTEGPLDAAGVSNSGRAVERRWAVSAPFRGCIRRSRLMECSECLNTG